METSILSIPALTPENLAFTKLSIADLDRNFLSEPVTPTKGYRSFDFGASNGHAGGRIRSSQQALARSSRQVTRASNRSSSFMSVHKSKMSAELTAQAETKFLALMEHVANTSREANSLKEFWARIVSDRESFAQEREELMEQITQVSEELELKDTEKHKHGNELIERKKQVEKLLVELSATINAVSSLKKTVAERDREIERFQSEVHETKEIYTRARADYDRLRGELDTIELTLKCAEDDRNSARDDADRHLKEVHRLTRERTEMGSKLSDVASKHDHSRREVTSLTERLRLCELERDEHLHECERYKEEVRKAKARAEEVEREILEITEKFERSTRECNKLKEQVKTLETEQESLYHTVEHLRRELKTCTTSCQEAEERASEASLRHEHVKREVLTLKEKVRDVELERDEHADTIERLREQHRLIVVERDELKDEVTGANRKADDARRQVLTLTDSLRRTELTLTEVRSEAQSLTDRVKQVCIERDHANDKCRHLHTETTELKEQMVAFQAEVRTVCETRDRLRHDLERSRRECEDVTETITEYHNGSSELEFEIENLRTLLREAREQKERAISARNTADRERDEFMAKYDEKCRELERFEESAAAHYHSSYRGSGMGMESRTTSTRTVSRHNTISASAD